MAGNNLNRATPVIDYTALDAEAIAADLIEFAQANYSNLWTDFNDGDLGVFLIDQGAYQFDMAVFYLNALVNETFVATAIRRQNVLEKVRAFDYEPADATSASVTVTLTLDPGAVYPQTILAATHIVGTRGSGAVQFYPDLDTTIASYGSGTVDITVTEGTRYNGAILGTSDGLAAQRYKLSQKNVRLDTIAVRVNGETWTKASFISEMQTADKQYLVETNDNDETFVIFGDGVNGLIPTSGLAIIADFRVTSGSAGNVAAGTITSIVSMPDAVVSVTNAAKATGGGPKATLQAIRQGFPGSLSTKTGSLNEGDFAAAAVAVAGVAKATAAAGSLLTRTVNVYVAPNGGGLPSATLKNTVGLALRENKQVGIRNVIGDPVYKDLDLDLIVHCTSGTRQVDAIQLVQTTLINAEGSGLLDFENVGFGGTDAEGNPYASVQRFADTFAELTSRGISRVEIRGLSVVPADRTLVNTTGNGTFSGIALPTNDHKRREWLIRFTSPTTFDVLERYVGTVSGIQDTVLTDDNAEFLTTIVSQGFTILNPDRRLPTTVTVTAASTTALTVAAGGLFELTEIGAQYYVERPLAATGVVGTPYNALDGFGQNVLDFTVSSGASPWAVGDEVIIDTYPPVSDITLRDDEIPQMLSVNLSIRATGGVAT